jgi:catabolite regulation protein CreA
MPNCVIQVVGGWSTEKNDAAISGNQTGNKPRELKKYW